MIRVKHLLSYVRLFQCAQAENGQTDAKCPNAGPQDEIATKQWQEDENLTACPLDPGIVAISEVSVFEGRVISKIVVRK